jgi:hypothetical protein
VRRAFPLRVRVEKGAGSSLRERRSFRREPETISRGCPDADDRRALDDSGGRLGRHGQGNSASGMIKASKVTATPDLAGHLTRGDLQGGEGRGPRYELNSGPILQGQEEERVAGARPLREG